MTKTDAIDAIVRLNPTANPAFLAGFSNGDLVEYLRRLSAGPAGDRFGEPDYSILSDRGRGPAFPDMDCVS